LKRRAIRRSLTKNKLMGKTHVKSMLTAALAGALAATGAAAQDTVIHAGTALIRADESPRQQVSILIEDGDITGVEDGFLTPDGAEIIDLSDRFVMAGMIDSHVHLLGELGPDQLLRTVQRSESDAALDGAKFARRTLEAGFTTVQDVGGSLEPIVRTSCTCWAINTPATARRNAAKRCGHWSGAGRM